jgi:hypothetical protein
LHGWGGLFVFDENRPESGPSQTSSSAPAGVQDDAAAHSKYYNAWILKRCCFFPDLLDFLGGRRRSRLG